MRTTRHPHRYNTRRARRYYGARTRATAYAAPANAAIAILAIVAPAATVHGLWLLSGL